MAAPAFIFFKNKTVLDSVNGADQEALQTLLGKHASLERDCADSLESTVVSNPKHDTPDPKRQENCFPLSNGHLQSIWQPEAFQNLDPTCLPPTHHFNDVLSQLSVTLNQSTQLRAARSPIETPISEPTLTLYCPVESGEVSFIVLYQYEFLGLWSRYSTSSMPLLKSSHAEQAPKYK